MTTRVLAAATAVIGLSVACVSSELKNVNCEWPAAHATGKLDLSSSSDARHLADDAQTAEDLAIRHADASHGRATHSRDVTEYRAVREQCKALLFAVVARRHAVPEEAVAAAVSDRREWLDALVILAFAAIFALVARLVSAFMFRGALAESRLLGASLLLATALAAGGIGLLTSGVWFGLIESVRVGNGHMSYRVERIPIRQHPLVVAFVCSAIFAGVSAIQYRRARI